MTIFTAINPQHYKEFPKGIERECIDYIEHVPYTQGCAGKYIYRAGNKDPLLQDLDKSVWYLNKSLSSNVGLSLAPYHSDLLNTIRTGVSCRALIFYKILICNLEEALELIEYTSMMEDIEIPLDQEKFLGWRLDVRKKQK